MPDATLERAVDDALLVAEEIRAGGTPDVGSRAADPVIEAFMPVLNTWIAKHPAQRKGAIRASEMVATAAADYLAAQTLLAAGVLLWATEHTEVPMTEILTGVRGRMED